MHVKLNWPGDLDVFDDQRPGPWSPKVQLRSKYIERGLWNKYWLKPECLRFKDLDFVARRIFNATNRISSGMQMDNIRRLKRIKKQRFKIWDICATNTY